ncbi:MAG: acyltransferase family protein [Firmicutes bacterium]|nr:acyltransferase family protein [Bacillota bacterium]
MQKTHSHYYVHLDFLRILSAVMVIAIHCLITITDETPFTHAAAANIIHNILNFSVPMFLIITGGLLMSNEKEYTYKDMLKKYILRALLSIIVFGTAFALLELVVTYRTVNLNILLTSVLYMLTGRSFDHMWYLYTLIGLYLITPVFKPFLKSAPKRRVECFLLALFVVNYVFPCVNSIFDISIAFTLPITKWPIFYYIYGYYLMVHTADLKKAFPAVAVIIVSICCIAALSVLGTADERFEPIAGQGSPFIIAIVTAVYLLARKHVTAPRKIYSLLSPLALGIYIIHPVFIHIFRFAGISANEYPYLYPVLIAVVFVLATAASYAMNAVLHFAMRQASKILAKLRAR